MVEYTPEQIERIAAMILYYREAENLKQSGEGIANIIGAQYRIVTPKDVRDKVDSFLKDPSELTKIIVRIQSSNSK